MPEELPNRRARRDGHAAVDQPDVAMDAAVYAGRVQMTRQELETWLCGGRTPVITPAEIAAVLGVPLDEIDDTTLLRVAERLAGVRFTIAVLRDVYPDDPSVGRWLRVPRAELGGGTGVDFLRAGRAGPVEELAMREWHRPSVAAPAAASARPTASPMEEQRALDLV
jgi:hypothetical protein